MCSVMSNTLIIDVNKGFEWQIVNIGRGGIQLINVASRPSIACFHCEL